MARRSHDSEQLRLSFPDSNEIHRLQNENHHLNAMNKRLQIQNASLVEEIERLQQLIQSSSTEVHNDTEGPLENNTSRLGSTEWSHLQTITKRSSIEDKVALFRSYFKGREDVYAVRSSGGIGRASYFTKREYLGKENGKIIWGENLPLTDAVLRAHLQEEKNPVTVGIYPLLLDETCWFLAIDFDKDSWKEDTAAFLETCVKYNVPAALERSRSGNGGHVWVFFAEPVSARMARTLGSALLTRCLEWRHQIGFESYDRMFPNQDTLPKDKKLGNLIALPLQRLPGKEGNSLFVDGDYKPFQDQWVFLSSLRKMKRSEIQAVISDAQHQSDSIRISESSTDINGEVDPWDSSYHHSHLPLQDILPSKMKLVLANQLYLEKKELTSSQIHYFMRMATFQNPEFYRAQSMRLSTYGKPRLINCSEDYPEYIALPRGCQDEVLQILRDRDIELDIEDRRNPGTPIDVTFQGKLRGDQHRAAIELLKHEIGTLAATTAFGKTVVGSWMIAARARNTLVLVHRTQLMEQWRERLSVFLNIPSKEIGMIGGGKNNRTGKIDIALIQSVCKNSEVKDFVADYGHIIVDECHHISAVSFEQVLKKAEAKYVLGLTATLSRKDGKHPIVLMQCGPVRFKVDAKSQAKARPFHHVVIPRTTQFTLPHTESNIPIQQLYEQLIMNESRNDLIFDDLLTALDEGRSPILLTDRTSHLEYFEDRLKGFAKNIIVMRGGMGKRQWKETMDRLQAIPTNEERVILATGRFVGEGFDDERLDTLFLVMPISWKGTLQQYAGRLHRLYEQKDEVRIYDYVDAKVPVLERMYQKRLKGYRAMGYSERSLGQEGEH